MKQYSFLNESVGRNLIGASKFASRKSVSQAIMQQYPQPQLLADRLQQMADQSYGKEKETLLNLSLKCRGLDVASYPSFVKSISGFSSIWKYMGIAAATAGAAAATKYAINRADEYLQNNDPNNVSTSGMFKHIGNSAINDTNKLAKNVAIGIGKVPGATTLKKVPGLQQVNDYMKSGQAATRAVDATGKTISGWYNNAQKYVNTALQNRSQNIHNEIMKNQAIYHAPQTQQQTPQYYSLTSPILKRAFGWS